MKPFIEDEYYAVGGNRHSAAADWSLATGFLAFGADQNVAVWSPLNDSSRGISALLPGHTAKITTVKFISLNDGSDGLLVTGAADGEIRLWQYGKTWAHVHTAAAHQGSVNTIAILDNSNIFATGGADARVNLWKVQDGKLEALSTLELKPKFMPLALALGPFSETSIDSAFLVVGGTRNDIQVYSIECLSSTPQFKLCATLTGHEAWIRSLALTAAPDGEFFLASAAQDKYVRLWRFQPGDAAATIKRSVDPTHSITVTDTLTAKIQSVSAADSTYSITFEALLLGHEDWVYSAAWSPNESSQRLLTASADGSLSVWESDPSSGIWVSVSRLGEISGQKGATTATGSSGGFWTGLWSPDGMMVASLGRTGSWRLWQYNSESQFWTQKHGISGHISSVNGICWSPDGGYLLSTSSDQTTRLHAEWKRGAKRTWHEFARPQIHGYDLNCIACTSPYQFSSGADEKLLRVFNEPKDIASMLHKLCQIALPPEDKALPDTAAIPVLGLSNKAMDDSKEAGDDDAVEELEPGLENDGLGASLSNIEEPPHEDLLSRHTLWPEHEKLYGHGYEISEAATPVDGHVLATACKASSIDHAVIRLYDTERWNEIKPPLPAHSLTVTRLAFSDEPEGFLLSVGRDRQFAVFQHSENDIKSWTRIAINAKAHSRMILDGTWLRNTHRPTFATAGRDKVVRIWSGNLKDERFEFTCKVSIARKVSVTAISAVAHGDTMILALGEDDGTISLHLIKCTDEIELVKSVDIDKHLCPSKTVNRLAWRPGKEASEGNDHGHLAVASSDSSVRIWKIEWRSWAES
ncbi:Elongator subunit elp2 [Rhinocladiella similis]